MAQRLRVAPVFGVRSRRCCWPDWPSYKRFGFEESPTDPLHLVLLMKDLRAFLAAAE